MEFQVVKVREGTSSSEEDHLAVEEPLEIQVGVDEAPAPKWSAISITMRTPGDDFDLAIGFLFTEGLLRGVGDITEVQHWGPFVGEDKLRNIVRLTLRAEAHFDPSRVQRNFYTSSSCGVCGKASLEALRFAAAAPLPRSSPLIDHDLVHQLPPRLRERQKMFESTGGIHAAGLFDAAGNLLRLREDVGRHNAVDKLIGSFLREEYAGFGSNILLVSGRASFELVQKAAMAGIPILAAVGAPSSLAVQVAHNLGMTLLGFVRDDRFNIYAGAERIGSSL